MRAPHRLSLPLSKAPERVERLVFSPDGAHLAAVRQRRGTTGQTAIGSVLLLRLSDGVAVASLMGETAVFVSAERLITSRYRTYGYLISAADGRELRSIGLGPPAAFAPRSGRVAASNYAGGVSLFEPEKSDSPVSYFQGKKGDPLAVDVAFSPDEQRVVVALEGGELRGFLVHGGAPDAALSRGQIGAFRAAFSPDGALLAVGKLDGGLEVFDAASGASHLSVACGGSPLSVAFSPDGALLAAGDDAQVQILDPRTGAALRRLACPGESVAFSPDGRRLAAGGPDAVQIVDPRGDAPGEAPAPSPAAFSLLSPRRARRDQEPGGSLGPVQSVAFSPDGGAVLSAVGASVILRDARDLSVLHAVELAPNERVVRRTSRMGAHEVLDLRCDLRVSVGFSAGAPVAAEWAASGAVEGRSAADVVVRSARGGAPLAQLRGHSSPVRAVIFDPASERAITLAEQAILWDLRGGGRALGQARAEAAAFGPGGRVALVDGGVVTLWGSDGGARVVDHGARVAAVAFDPAGQLVATLGGGRAQVARVDGGQRLLCVDTAQGEGSLAFGGGGLAVADGALRVLRISDGASLGSASQQGASRVVLVASSPAGALAWSPTQTAELCLA